MLVYKGCQVFLRILILRIENIDKNTKVIVGINPDLRTAIVRYPEFIKPRISYIIVMLVVQLVLCLLRVNKIMRMKTWRRASNSSLTFSVQTTFSFTQTYCSW